MSNYTILKFCYEETEDYDKGKLGLDSNHVLFSLGDNSHRGFFRIRDGGLPLGT
jgi:hypothetical protein